MIRVKLTKGLEISAGLKYTNSGDAGESEEQREKEEGEGRLAKDGLLWSVVMFKHVRSEEVKSDDIGTGCDPAGR